MDSEKLALSKYPAAITASGLSIYDPIQIGDSKLWIPARELGCLLSTGLQGTSLAGLPLRTRSKVVKEKVCRILGYPIPRSFKKSRPKFPGQAFDIYIQKSRNLQIWNDELSSSRRYVIVKVSAEDIIKHVKVVAGDALDLLDTTGTLTQKYQARITIPSGAQPELFSLTDTMELLPYVSKPGELTAFAGSSIDCPEIGKILPIKEVFARLSLLIGKSFNDPGSVQERNRGAGLHKLICRALGYGDSRDAGCFPDIPHQLLEVKLQTSPTIDLGLVRPNDMALLEIPEGNGIRARHCDVRYAVFYGETDGKKVKLNYLCLVTGEQFFSRFPQFQGRVLNKKLQIPLPWDFFDSEPEGLPD